MTDQVAVAEHNRKHGGWTERRRSGERSQAEVGDEDVAALQPRWICAGERRHVHASARLPTAPRRFTCPDSPWPSDPLRP